MVISIMTVALIVSPVSSLSDADFDGVIDSLDDCKYQQEIYNQFQDTDGCPDIISDDYSAIFLQNINH